jgi:serine/threonine protein kinase
MSNAGVTHRDLKLENIMIRKQDSSEAIIIDFGLSAC